MPRAFVIDPAKAMTLKDFGRALAPHRPYRTVLQWCLNGRRNRRMRTTVFLEYIVLPTGMATDMSAYERFVEKLTERPQ